MRTWTAGRAVGSPGPLEDDSGDGAACRAREIIGRVGDKWTVAVVHALGNGPLRFTEIRRGVDGISQRMLTTTLRALERDGLVSRTVYPEIPPRVDYELTPVGQSLLDTLWLLMNWAVLHTEDIDRARREYDAK
ncbi:winged helix-turn-helix transcriptional regulator [Parafrankia discariae]|uniref:winged helix-turn-helix transcriptional regulator n=1 Tax=Parafrankia discariae TaxID=365528 RepID=UPI0005586267|nr:helix-turn-helix domain-containing protein [Parafrankia discariae]